MADKQPSWHWKVPGLEDERQPGLLYEPGNWGDVLKGTWAAVTAGVLAAAIEDHRPLRYLDPFAGMPTYPLLGSTAARLRWLGSGAFVRAQEHWLERGELAGTAILVRQAAAARDVRAVLEVFDADPRCRESWHRVEGARFLDVASGEEALKEAQADLILVDPYDLFDRWQDILPAALDAAGSSTVLLYLYNKSPRGGGHLRNYNALRSHLERLPTGRGLILGRIPSDLILPRAFHEMVLMAPAAVAAAAQGDLRRSTQNLACKMSTMGCFEGSGGTRDLE